jgi:hypothetical protein
MSLSQDYKYQYHPRMTPEQSKQFNTTTDTNKDKENKYQFVQYTRPDPIALLKAVHPDKAGRRRKTTQRRRRRKPQTQKRKQDKSKRTRRM